MTNILALDLSTVKTGCAWGSETDIEGTQPIAAKGWLPMRRLACGMAINLHVDVVAIEDVYYADNPLTFKVLCKLQGATEADLVWTGFKVLFASTAEIDAACGIPHTDRAQRKAATRRIAELLRPGVEMSEDECDAVCLLVWAQGRVKVQGWEEMSVEA